MKLQQKIVRVPSELFRVLYLTSAYTKVEVSKKDKKFNGLTVNDGEKSLLIISEKSRF